MKPISYSKEFQKHFRLRVAHQPALLRQFRNRTMLFLQDKQHVLLRDHALTGQLDGFRSFSVAGDVRVIYRETATHFEFVDVGSHNQVYK